MLREAPSTDRSVLPGRAGIAMLTLQLRAALQEAAAAEAEAATADADAAREKLRARLEPLMEDRRSGFDAELSQVRAEAAAAIAAARRAAAAMVAQKHSLVDRVAQPAAEPNPPAEEVVRAPIAAIAAPVATPPVIVPPVIAPVALAPLSAPTALAPPVEPIPPVEEMLRWFDDIPAPTVEVVAHDSQGAVAPELPTVVDPDPSPAQLTATNVSIDTEAFAQAFAAAFAAALDERSSTWGVGVAGPAALSAAPAPTTPKPSFWTHARHPDVLLIGLAMVIMLIVVAAWLA